MHVYSIDKDIRRKVIVIIFCISIFISIIMKYLLSVPIEFIGECIKKVELLKILLQIGNNRFSNVTLRGKYAREGYLVS